MAPKRKKPRSRYGNVPDPKKVADLYLSAANRNLSYEKMNCREVHKALTQAAKAIHRASGDTYGLTIRYNRIKTKYEGRC